MKIAGRKWRRHISYFIALYAIISVSLGVVISPTSLANLRSAPLPANHEAPIVQVYAARTWGKKGALAVHTWIVTKRRGAAFYNRHEIVGWQLRWSSSALRSGSWSANDKPDWFGNPAILLVDHRGSGVEAMIDRIDHAIENYPYKDQYQIWPGPNSNTFTAWRIHTISAIPLVKKRGRIDLPKNLTPNQRNRTNETLSTVKQRRKVLYLECIKFRPDSKRSGSGAWSSSFDGLS